jgi:hypothetical protein
MLDHLIEKLEIVFRKVHCHCRSKCCGDFVNITTNIFQRSNTTIDLTSL